MTFELEYCKVLPPSILYYETRSLIARLAIFVAWNMKRVKGQNEIIRRLNHQFASSSKSSKTLVSQDVVDYFDINQRIMAGNFDLCLSIVLFGKEHLIKRCFTLFPLFQLHCHQN
jgi:hypothetical protein